MEFLSLIFPKKPVWMWLLCAGIAVALLVFDLGVLTKTGQKSGVSKA